MIKRVTLFALGFLIGIGFDMVPHAVEIIANTNVCRESCSNSLKAISIAIYASLPIALGCIFATVNGKSQWKRKLLTSSIASLILISLLTWFLYRHQHP